MERWIVYSWAATFVGLLAFTSTGLMVAIFLPVKTRLMGAPLAGIAIWPMASLAVYVETRLPFDTASWLAMGALTVVGGLLTCSRGISIGEIWRALAAIAAVSALIGPITMAAWIHRGEPALLYVDGTDHLGYSMVADWIRSHGPQTLSGSPSGVATIGPAVADPATPYTSWPELMFEAGPRGGAFAYLAILSALFHLPAMFSYDLAVAIALTAACIGCAAIFTSSWGGFFLLAFCLATSHWYDYGHTGFLGKLLGYPLVIFVFGLFLSFRAALGTKQIIILVFVACGAALLHDGYGFAVLFIVLAGPLILVRSFSESSLPSSDDIFLTVAIGAIAVIASGTLARPLSTVGGFPDFHFDWLRISLLSADLNNVFRAVAPIRGISLSLLLVVSAACWAVLVVLAFDGRHVAAISLLCGPALFILILYAAAMRTTAAQLAGFLYPAALCAVFSLWPEAKQTSVRLALGFTAAVLLIGSHLPRLINSVERYAVDPDQRQIFSIGDFDKITTAAGGESIYVDVKGTVWTVLPVLAELGRRDAHLVWSPGSWTLAVGGYRGWAAPSADPIPSIRLVDATDPPVGDERVLIMTPRYRLVSRK